MLPFRKKKGESEAMELTEDDLVLVEEAPAPVRPDSVRAVRAPRKTSARAGSRRIVDENVEEDVAGQCLASIAAETSRIDSIDVELVELVDPPYSRSSSHVRAAALRPGGFRSAPPPLPGRAASFEGLGAFEEPPTLSQRVLVAGTVTGSQRLPAITPPRFVRATATSGSALRGETPLEVPGVRDSTPPPAFVRRSAPALATAAPHRAAADAVDAKWTPASPGLSNVAASIAPVSMPAPGVAPRPNEPTVILLRERPKVRWILAAAALGALGALAAVRLSSPEGRVVRPPMAAAQTPSTPVAATAPPSEGVVPIAAAAATAAANAAPTSAAPPATVPNPSASAPAPAASAAVVHFDDAQGVAIQSPHRTPSIAPAPPAAAAPLVHTPVTSQATARALRPLGAALPDGSFSLGKSDTPAAGTAAALPAAPTAAPKRALTPEQELAAAQLKASMK